MKTQQDYLDLLENSYKVTLESDECPPKSRLEYLGDYIFDFITYDGEMSVLFARKAVEVCKAINNSQTFEYIQDPGNYQWYLLMCNTLFFEGKLSWGSSVRGAWWDNSIKFQSCGLFKGYDQIANPITFSKEEWESFIAAIIAFADK